ncbi:MAG: serine acetyltransferase [Planctomycetota bacterium]|jgi:serine O-acetyltransferase|nr:serine acetyltransferase [Planctomycetota bacterium]
MPATLSAVLAELLKTYDDNVGINRTERHDLPRAQAVKQTLSLLFDVLFPGFSDSGHPVTEDNLGYHLGDLLNHITLELSAEIERAIRYSCRAKHCEQCQVQTQSATMVQKFLAALPRLRAVIKTDVQAGYDGDPAAQSIDEVIVSYPGVMATTTHRLAHELFTLGVPLIPRMWSEHAHSVTGIDIHPGATIGKSFFIDHGTGTVIGETCVIGEHVQLYQGVTLGALSPADGQKLRGQRRHPTIEDHVVVYAGATILGGDTVIGHNSMIGGNVWLTASVPPYSRVVLPQADLNVITHNAK